MGTTRAHRRAPTMPTCISQEFQEPAETFAEFGRLRDSNEGKEKGISVRNKSPHQGSSMSISRNYNTSFFC